MSSRWGVDARGSRRWVGGAIALWAVWAALLIGFQTLVDLRYQPNRPDRALAWTPNETGRSGQDAKPYLLDPFLNHQVSFDSEFYLSIAVFGYDDPNLRTANTPDGAIPLNYAFFPLYPLLMSVVAVPFGWLGLTPLAAATAAGVLISLIGALVGVIALARLAGPDGERAAFYLLIFPTAFFMATVYTEGLFVGLAFASLALAHDRRLWLAGICAALAVWTRSVGIALMIPLLLAWLAVLPRPFRVTPALLIRGLPVLLPLLAYAIWWAVNGAAFTAVQENFFGRGFFNFPALIAGVNAAIAAVTAGDNPQTQIYFLLELAAVLLALICALALLRRDPGVALFSLAALVLAVSSGAPQSLIRYVLPLPATYLVLARLGGRFPTFDRAWTIASLLLFAMQASLFTFDLWVA